MIGGPSEAGLEGAIEDLTPEQTYLFELIGVLGGGHWHYNMLAAVALRRPADVKQVLDVLVDRGLVESSTEHRYRVNMRIRQFLRRRLAQRGEYAVQAAQTLLARYCLDAAQDLLGVLAARPELGAGLGRHDNEPDAALVRAFRDRLIPDMSHVREVFGWAERNEMWDLILRYSQLPYRGILDGLFSSGFEIKTSFTMATINEPIMASRGGNLVLGMRSFVGCSSDLVVRDKATIMLHISSHGEMLETLYVEREDRSDQDCKLELGIMAGYIVNGIFERAYFVDAKWVGVRAPRLLLKMVDMVGSHLLACDLSHSLWISCDARRTSLVGSNLSYAVISKVKFHGANLQGVNFAGALLSDVDFRGADLRGADFTSARLYDVCLTGCRVEGARWSSVPENLDSEDEALADDIRRAVTGASALVGEPAYWSLPPACSIEAPDQQPCDLGSQDISHRDFYGADLRSARLAGVNGQGANLDEALLGSADLSGAQLADAILTDADMRAAVLQGAQLQRANLEDALLGLADLTGADLSDARLEGADLRGAVLNGANLQRANLEGAVLTMADLTGANLTEANLTGTDLRAAILTGANLCGAKLDGAKLDGTRLAGFDPTVPQATPASQGTAVVDTSGLPRPA